MYALVQAVQVTSRWQPTGRVDQLPVELRSSGDCSRWHKREKCASVRPKDIERTASQN